MKKRNAKKPKTKEDLDDELLAYMQKVPLVTGSPIKKLKERKIPVSISVGMNAFKDLVDEGWETSGEVDVLNGNAYLWYTKVQDERF